jgi:transposase
MNDKSLYQQILGDTSPWKVASVSLDVEKLCVDVRLELDSNAIWACPECRRRMHVKQRRTRRWRHLDSCQFKTFIEADVPVVECEQHGCQTVQVPWAEKSSRFTLLFERFAIGVLEACATSRAKELLDISWAEADGIKRRAVARGLSRRSLEGLEYVCVDEKQVAGGSMMTIVTGILQGKPRMLFATEGCSAESLDRFWEWLGPQGCARIRAVGVDMGKAYPCSVRRNCPPAELVYDPFHIMKLVNRAVNEVRGCEMRCARSCDRELLKGSRQLWLWGEENLPARHAERFEELKNSTLKTARAWRLKELWRTFRHCVDEADGRAFFRKWYRHAMLSKLEPVKKVARTLKKHIDGIVTVLKHGFCNAFAEGMNSRIQLMVQKACGYRNMERLKTDLLFHLGGLKMDPVQ